MPVILRPLAVECVVAFERKTQAIAATPMVGVKTFLETTFGQSFTSNGFGNWFRDQCDAAELIH
jgi:hypothetical protein